MQKWEKAALLQSPPGKSECRPEHSSSWIIDRTSSRTTSPKAAEKNLIAGVEHGFLRGKNPFWCNRNPFERFFSLIEAWKWANKNQSLRESPQRHVRLLFSQPGWLSSAPYVASWCDLFSPQVCAEEEAEPMWGVPSALGCRKGRDRHPAPTLWLLSGKSEMWENSHNNKTQQNPPLSPSK